MKDWQLLEGIGVLKELSVAEFFLFFYIYFVYCWGNG